jgi:protein-S-isoprenylcysteine O-methyltransferase Ste14
VSFDRLELLVRQLGAIAVLSTLAIAIAASVISLRQAPAREEPAAGLLLRVPAMLLASAFFLALAALGWRPLPIQLSPSLRTIALALGCPLLIGGLSLYLWGLLSLRGMFAPSSGFAARIQAARKLITSGPYALVRHPMYLGVIMATIGILFLYRTWIGQVFSITMFGLNIRARREERLLADEFEVMWEGYAFRVPMWFPAPRSRHEGGA